MLPLNRRPKILILYAMFGDGHYQVSQALKQQFLEQGIEDVKMIDLFAESHPRFNGLFRFLYDKSAAWFPNIYGWIYHITNEMSPDRLFGRWLHSFGAGRLKKMLDQEQPDAVIHTFPFLAMYELRRASDCRTPGFTVITDYVLHNRWIHPETDGYFVATKALKDSMVARGVKQDRISVTGIPLRGRFAEPVRVSEIQRKYGLNPKKRYVLVMAGANGTLPDLKAVMRELLLMDDGFAFILVAGRNERMYMELEALYSGVSDVHVFGYVKEIEKLMRAASCIVTKAGGITIAEAMALRVPAVVYRPLPGQEEGNAEFWAERGVLRIADSPEKLKQAIIEQAKPGAGGKAAKPRSDAPSFAAARLVVDKVLREFELNSTSTSTSPVIPQRRKRQVIF